METYIQVSFWLTLFAVITRTIGLGVDEWPRNKTVTLGESCSIIIINLGFLLWAGIVLWMK